MFNEENINKIMQCIKGSKIMNIMYQPTKHILSDDNMFVINFKNKEEEYSIHVFCYLRIRNNQQILLTSADEYFNIDYNKLTSEEYDSQKKFEKSLISVRIRDTKKLLKDAVVAQVLVAKYGDMLIYFDNEIVLEISIDCSYDNYEYYRMIDLKRENNFIKVFFKDRELMNKIIWN